MIAVVVTEYEWDAPAYGIRPAGPVRSRIGHVDPSCPHVKAVEIVDRDVPMHSRAAGLPCSYCVPVVEGPFGPPRATPDRTPGEKDRKAVPAPAAVRSGGPKVPADVQRLGQPNRYGGDCVGCGRVVAPHGGFLGRQEGLFVVICGECLDA